MFCFVCVVVPGKNLELMLLIMRYGLWTPKGPVIEFFAVWDFALFRIEFGAIGGSRSSENSWQY